MKINDPTFFASVRHSQKVLVIDLGFLGDTIHLIPALHTIRKALPQAQLHVVCASHIQSILELTPWVDHVIGYQRFPKRLPWYKDILFLYNLFKGKYDLVINLSGSQRSCYFSWFTMAPYRLGRIQQRPFLLRPLCFTHAANFPFGTMHKAKQRCQILHQAGFPAQPFSYPIAIPEKATATIQRIIPKNTRFININPFANLDYREIPIPILAQCINSLSQRYQLPYTLCIAPTQREKAKLQPLLSLLKQPPLHIFEGTLSIPELTALISQAVLHIGNDSGPLHIACLTQTPAVACFRNDPTNNTEWMPDTDNNYYRCIIGESSPEGLQNISAQQLFSACQSLLKYHL